MMYGFKIVMVVVFSALFGSLVPLLPAQDLQTKKPPDAASGAELYERHCSVCHGSDLKRSGLFPPPYRKPPDLTTLARRHGGKFPEAYVARILKNGVTLPAHGPAEMPVWGSDFAAEEHADAAEVTARIRRLVNYVKSVQQK